MRITLRMFRQQADPLQQFRDFLLRAFSHAMHQQRFHDGIADSQARIQRSERILENELNIPS